MIGRQFTYYCCPQDLDLIESKVFRPLGGRILRKKKIDGREELLEENKFSLSLQDMGKAPLHLVLAPPEDLLLIKYQSFWIDMELSHLMEIGRCLIKDGVIHPGRFWYVPKTYVDRVNVDKPSEYLKWAQAIFKETKKLLSKSKNNESNRFGYFYGPVALKEIENENLETSPN